ncbi:MAG TPA: hypothetical protein VF600_09775 [Abditibacteriaceae bacterium]|jgi:regulator of protease activity HflC (stomatin/prohibitin superfamily)
MPVEALLFLVIVLLVLRPLVQRQQERALAERLKKTRDPWEAMIAVDNPMQASKQEGSFTAKLRESYWFWLR